jgi:hypothetical protein
MIFVYGLLSRRRLETKFEDVRSGLFTSFAEWAAKHTADTAHQQERSWKPNLLIPVTDVSVLQGSFSLIKDIAFPKGGAVLMGISNGNYQSLKEKLNYISRSFKKDDVFSSVTLMRTESFAEGVNFGNQALGAAFFKPNIVFLNMAEQEKAVQDFPKVIEEARRLELGVILYTPHARAMLGQQQNINVWVREQGPDWRFSEKQTHDLALLIAYKIKSNWTARTTIITVVNNAEEEDKAKKYLQELIDLARLPIETTLVICGSFTQQFVHAPLADLNIFGIFPDKEIDYYREVAMKTNTSCLFILDSGHENIFA